MASRVRAAKSGTRIWLLTGHDAAVEEQRLQLDRLARDIEPLRDVVPVVREAPARLRQRPLRPRVAPAQLEVLPGLQNLEVDTFFRPRKRMSSYFLLKRGVQILRCGTR